LREVILRQAQALATFPNIDRFDRDPVHTNSRHPPALSVRERLRHRFQQLFTDFAEFALLAAFNGGMRAL
jgi:hypothetical protein